MHRSSFDAGHNRPPLAQADRAELLRYPFSYQE